MGISEWGFSGGTSDFDIEFKFRDIIQAELEFYLLPGSTVSFVRVTKFAHYLKINFGRARGSLSGYIVTTVVT